MKKELLNQAKKILNNFDTFPTGIDMETRLNLVDVDAMREEYWGNKYAEGESCFINYATGLQFKHSMVENPFWVVFFHGAQYKSEEEIFVLAYWDKPNLGDAIYRQDSIQADDENDGVETIMDIVDKFNRQWIENDGLEEDIEPLLNDSPRAICDLTEELISVLHLDIFISTPLKEISTSEVERLQNALERAEEAYRENEGKNILNEMLSGKDCPSMLKDFVKKHSICKVEFDKYVQNEDYMPDYGWYIELSSEDSRFGFLIEKTSSYGDPDSSFEEYEFCNDTHFAEKIKEYEFLMPEDEWRDKDTKQALKTWEYVLSYSKIGHERKLFI